MYRRWNAGSSRIGRLQTGIALAIVACAVLWAAPFVAAAPQGFEDSAAQDAAMGGAANGDTANGAPTAGAENTAEGETLGRLGEPAKQPDGVWRLEGAQTVGERYGATPVTPGAEGANSEATTVPAPPGVTVGEYFKVLGWLVAVVILAVATIYGLKKLQLGTARLAGTGRVMEVVARTGLTSKHQLVMVRVAERMLVVGVSPDGVHRVAEFTDPKDVVEISRGGESFQEQLDAQDIDVAAAESEAQEQSIDVAPYRREIGNLKDLIGKWKRSSSSSTGGRN